MNEGQRWQFLKLNCMHLYESFYASSSHFVLTECSLDRDRRHRNQMRCFLSKGIHLR
jgi:hypothetical protein